jgi:outer membrane protein insertion porin family
MDYTIKKYLKIIYVIAFAFAISSCSNIKFLKKGETLYTGAKIIVKSDSLGKK